MESWTTASVERVETCAFSVFPGQKKPKIAPKMGVRNPFSPPQLDLEQACMARSSCRRVAALKKKSHQKHAFTPHFTYEE